jgi:putative transposase
MKVFNELKTPEVHDILIAVTDGLKGMPEALGAVFPATTLQTCIVHLIRNSLDFASWKDRNALAAAIKSVYTTVSAEAAESELDAFEAGPWGQKFPTPTCNCCLTIHSAASMQQRSRLRCGWRH